MLICDYQLLFKFLSFALFLGCQKTSHTNCHKFFENTVPCPFTHEKKEIPQSLSKVCTPSKVFILITVLNLLMPLNYIYCAS